MLKVTIEDHLIFNNIPYINNIIIAVFDRQLFVVVCEMSRLSLGGLE